MGGKASKLKGARWEREVAVIFKERVGGEVKRGLGQARGGSDVADVDGVPGLWIEAKHQQKVNFKAALRQASEASNKAGTSRKPVVVAKEDRSKPIVCLYLDDFLDLMFPNQDRYARSAIAVRKLAEKDPDRFKKIVEGCKPEIDGDGDAGKAR